MAKRRFTKADKLRIIQEAASNGVQEAARRFGDLLFVTGGGVEAVFPHD